MISAAWSVVTLTTISSSILNVPNSNDTQEDTYSFTSAHKTIFKSEFYSESRAIKHKSDNLYTSLYTGNENSSPRVLASNILIFTSAYKNNIRTNKLETMEVAQQILALDARYNSFRMSAFPQHSKLLITCCVSSLSFYTQELFTFGDGTSCCEKMPKLIQTRQYGRNTTSWDRIFCRKNMEP